MKDDVCDECGTYIPDTEPSMVNAAHDPSCSLYPGNAMEGGGQ